MSEMRSSRVWRFADCEFDEWSHQLAVSGQPSALDARPLDVLKYLLLFPGKTIGKPELIDKVWGAATSDDSVTKAISTLRGAIGGERESVIKTIHRVGYRFVAPLECILVEHPAATPTELQAGELVPGDERWRLLRSLDRGPRHATWLAEQNTTKQVQVFEFALEETGRESLGRELQAYRLLQVTYGQSAPRPSIYEAQFENSPFFLQAEDGGPNLRQWNEFASLALEARLSVFALLASAVADVHEAGIVHNDLRPENVVVSPRSHGEGWRVRLVNFKFATKLEPLSPEMERKWREKLNREVTYRPDELRSGLAEPSALTDTYALGVLLYQFACADLHERPSPGWELRVSDPLLQLDIAEAANGDPALRLASARELSTRVAGLERRRAERQREAEMADRAERAERALRETRARRKWLVALTLVLAAGLAASLLFHARAVKAKNIAESMNDFVAEDILGQDNLLLSRMGPDETLRSAIEHAIPEIDRRFKDEPAVAARLHEVVAGALQTRSQYEQAEEQYEAAARLYTQAAGTNSERASAALLSEAHMEARSHLSGALPRAQRILDEQAKLLRGRSLKAILQIRLFATQAIVAAESGDAAKAQNSKQQAEALARNTAELDPPLQTLLREQAPYIDLRTGHIAEAEHQARAAIADVKQKDGVDSSHLLIPELQLMEACMLQGKNDEAILLANDLYPKFQRQLGSDNDLTLQILGTRAAAEGQSERWEDSIRDELLAHQIATRRDPHSFFALGTLSDAAMNECRRGHWEQGETYARQSWSALNAEKNPQPGLLAGTALTLASCLVRFGDQKDQAKLREAAGLLGETKNEKYVAALTGNPGIAADFLFAKAQLAFADGDRMTAEKYARQAQPAFNAPEADQYQRKAITRFEKKAAARQLYGQRTE